MNMSLSFIEKIFSQNQIPGLGPIAGDIYKDILRKIGEGEKVTLVNIICPGYVRKREVGVEYFDFPKLSDNILECPNVLLMVNKMNRFINKLEEANLGDHAEIIMILADVAILNYSELRKRQNVANVLDKFYKSLEKLNINNEVVKFVKMSALKNEFKKIPTSGIKVTEAYSSYSNVNSSVIRKAKEYEGVLNFSRINEQLSKGDGLKIDYQSFAKRTNREVARFVVEYGLAGLAIRKLYKNPMVLFTEPSGYLRGFFYNSYLKSKDYLPVLYLC